MSETFTITLGPDESAILVLLVDSDDEFSAMGAAGNVEISEDAARVALHNLASLGLARRFGLPTYHATKEGSALIAKHRAKTSSRGEVAHDAPDWVSGRTSRRAAEPREGDHQ